MDKPESERLWVWEKYNRFPLERQCHYKKQLREPEYQKTFREQASLSRRVDRVDADGSVSRFTAGTKNSYNLNYRRWNGDNDYFCKIFL
jgi:hypothetical protein